VRRRIVYGSIGARKKFKKKRIDFCARERRQEKERRIEEKIPGKKSFGATNCGMKERKKKKRGTFRDNPLRKANGRKRSREKEKNNTGTLVLKGGKKRISDTTPSAGRQKRKKKR